MEYLTFPGVAPDRRGQRLFLVSRKTETKLVSCMIGFLVAGVNLVRFGAVISVISCDVHTLSQLIHMKPTMEFCDDLHFPLSGIHNFITATMKFQPWTVREKSAIK